MLSLDVAYTPTVTLVNVLDRVLPDQTNAQNKLQVHTDTLANQLQQKSLTEVLIWSLCLVIILGPAVIVLIPAQSG